MYPKNLERMIKLADEFFETKNDPAQISVTEETRAMLLRIDPSTMSELSNDQGPSAWVLVFPTTLDVMNQFISKTITEQDLLRKTSGGGVYHAIYLCSALVLPEFRGKGLAHQLSSAAIKSICSRHPITHLYYWSFSPEGEQLALSLAGEFGLSLLRRPD